MKKMIMIIAAITLSFAATGVWASDMKSKIKVSGGGTYDYFIVGEMVGATDGFDNAYDSFYPSGSLNDTYIMSYMSHPEWNTVKSEFRADIRSVEGLQEWDVNVYTNLPNGTVLTMSLMEGSSIPDNYAISVKDMSAAQVTNILTGQYVFAVTDNTQIRTFKVTATAQLPPQPTALTITKTGAGTVTANTGTITWNGNTGTATYDNNTKVTLTASASSGYTFTSWSGCDVSTGNTCIVTMASARSVAAAFTVNQHVLTVNMAGSGSGAVTSSPSGISCGSTCAASYTNGAPVTLSASKSADSFFAGWSGGGCSGTGACTVTMDDDHSVTATFTQYITVSAPNGGETWTRGKVQTIKWTYSGNPGSHVKIELLKNGAVKSTITARASMGAKGAGSHLWRVPKNMATGSDYQIRITSKTNSSYTDTSNGNFTIK